VAPSRILQLRVSCLLAVAGLGGAVACSSQSTAAPVVVSHDHLHLAAAASPGNGDVVPPAVTAVAFPEQAHGWALGVAGGQTRIWHTDTAGQSWQVQWHGTDPPLALTATGTLRAWALTGCPSPARAGCRDTLLATADGGAHWRIVGSLPKTVTRVSFSGSALGIATDEACSASSCHGTLLASQDGGVTWAPVLRAAGPVFATVSTTGQIWAAYPSSPTRVRFVASADVGRVWQPLGEWTSLFPLTKQVQITLAANAQDRLAWAAVVDRGDCSMHGCAVAALLGSAGQGSTWTEATLPKLPAGPIYDQCGGGWLSAMAAAADGAMWAATVQSSGACSPPFGEVYRDGPSGWQLLPDWQLTGLASIDAVSADVAYAISLNGALSRTGDGGQRWSQVLPAPEPTLDGQLDAVSADTAIAGGDANDPGAIMRSGNGGRTWRQLASLPGIVTRLDFLTSQDGYAATVTMSVSRLPVWRLWVTADGGSTWTLAGGLPSLTSTISSGALWIDYGPWMTADGHGIALTASDDIPWPPSSGSSPPVQEWTTDDGGRQWAAGPVLHLGGQDSLLFGATFARSTARPPAAQGPAAQGPAAQGPAAQGPAAPVAGWRGWLAGSTLQSVGGGLTPLPGQPEVNAVQLTGPGAGFAWQVVGNVPRYTLDLYRIAVAGDSWQLFRLPLPSDGGNTPLVSFSDLDHGWLFLGAATWRTSNGGRTWYPAS
jgi:photosystem II stability/assembly factor-like uncharacterized protein